MGGHSKVYSVPYRMEYELPKGLNHSAVIFLPGCWLYTLHCSLQAGDAHNLAAHWLGLGVWHTSNTGWFWSARTYWAGGEAGNRRDHASLACHRQRRHRSPGSRWRTGLQVLSIPRAPTGPRCSEPPYSTLITCFGVGALFFFFFFFAKLKNKSATACYFYYYFVVKKNC